MRIVDGLFTLANVAIGGVIGALATGRASRLSARADAIDDFNLVRPLWAQNVNPDTTSLDELQDRHIALRGKLLIAGVPYLLLEWYEAATITYLNLQRMPEQERLAMEASPEMAGATLETLSNFAFDCDRLINIYLQRPMEARLRYRGRSYRRQVKHLRMYLLANRPAL
jgi:hypothetical protein